MIDIRPLDVILPGVSFEQADATNLDTIEDGAMESVSALCSLEHFGLGRYGDPIDPEECFKCFEAIERKTKVDGDIYILVPIGAEHLEPESWIMVTKRTNTNRGNTFLYGFMSELILVVIS